LRLESGIIIIHHFKNQHRLPMNANDANDGIGKGVTVVNEARFKHTPFGTVIKGLILVALIDLNYLLTLH